MRAPLKVSGALVAIVFAAITYGLWAWINRPVDDPGWPERGLQGVAFSPFHEDQDPARSIFPTVEQIDADLRLLSAASIAAVRTYSTLNTLIHIPRLAGEHQIKVTLGAWLNDNRRLNEAEIANAIELAATQPSVIRVIVGNEALLRKDLSIEELTAHRGRWLQVRPKARDGSVRTIAWGSEGEAIATVPRGFYLRARFTAALLGDPSALPD